MALVLPGASNDSLQSSARLYTRIHRKVSIWILQLVQYSSRMKFEMVMAANPLENRLPSSPNYHRCSVDWSTAMSISDCFSSAKKVPVDHSMITQALHEYPTKVGAPASLASTKGPYVLP